MKPYAPRLKPLARKLRSQMTDVERLLWSRLRRKQVHGLQFYRQKPLGRYIVDFYCARAALVIEVDGFQHYSDDGAVRDRIRDEELNAMRLRVLRFDNGEVMRNTDGVMAVIEKAVVERESPQAPLLQRGGEQAGDPAEAGVATEIPLLQREDEEETPVHGRRKK